MLGDEGETIMTGIEALQAVQSVTVGGLPC
jgi:hypothetical protein